jgi:dCTP deaminase
MSVLVDWQIRDRCDPLLSQGDRLLDPFSEAVSGNNVISYGLSHCGYDLRLAEEFVLFEADPYWGHQTVMDPKRFHDDAYKNRITRRCSQNFPFTIPPHHYVLARTVEYVRMPNDLVGIVVGKSTYARSGILINCTPIEAAWQGHIVLEIGNCTPLPAVVYPNEGIAQLLFHRLLGIPEKTYADKGGKYQGQTGVTLAIV